MELNFEALEMKWNIPRDKAQRLDEKNGAICIVIICTVSYLVFLNVEILVAQNSIIYDIF